MELLTYTDIYRIVGDNASVSNEYITKSAAIQIADDNGYNVTSDLSQYLDNEYIDVFSVKTKEEFPDDSEHRWINISPTQFNFPADGGSVNITGSYGLTGTLGTRKEIGTISDTITVEANNTESSKSGSKTYYYNNDQSQQPTIDFSWTQPKQIFTYTYTISVNSSQDNTSSNTLIWEWNQVGGNFKKEIYVFAFKNKINNKGQIVDKQPVDFNMTCSSDAFAFSKKTTEGNIPNAIEVYPTTQNNSFNIFKSNINVCIKEDESVNTNVGLVVLEKGAYVFNGDLLVFKCIWDKGTDLDSATYLKLHAKFSQDKYYAGYKGQIPPEAKGMYGFAGDVTGNSGEEQSYINFKQAAKFLSEHGGDISNDNVHTILQRLTDENGITYIAMDIYTNWYNDRQSEDIQIQCSVYVENGLNPSISANSNKTFDITDYRLVSDEIKNAKCTAAGASNSESTLNLRSNYTHSARITYFVNSNIFAFYTNIDGDPMWEEHPGKYNPSNTPKQ